MSAALVLAERALRPMKPCAGGLRRAFCQRRRGGSCGQGAYAPVRLTLGPAVRAQRRLRRAASSGPGRKTR